MERAPRTLLLDALAAELWREAAKKRALEAGKRVHIFHFNLTRRSS